MAGTPAHGYQAVLSTFNTFTSRLHVYALHRTIRIGSLAWTARLGFLFGYCMYKRWRSIVH